LTNQTAVPTPSARRPVELRLWRHSRGPLISGEIMENADDIEVLSKALVGVIVACSAVPVVAGALALILN